MNWLYEKSCVLTAKSSAFFFLSAIVCVQSLQLPALAHTKVEAILQTRESMQEHTSDEPRRLMHDVLLEEFGKRKIIQIVNPENSALVVKYRSANYNVGANLIAFSFASNTPIHVSLSIQLMNKNTGKVILTSDRALAIDERIVESGLKLSKPEFDRSSYGQAIISLTRSAARLFEERVEKLNL